MLRNVRRPARIHREAKLYLESIKSKRISQEEWDAGAVVGLAADLIKSMERPEVSYSLDELYVVARFLHDAQFSYTDVLGIEESDQIVLMAICMMMKQHIEDGVMKIIGGLFDEQAE